MVRRYLHFLVDLICDLALEVYDTALDVRDWARDRFATETVPTWTDLDPNPAAQPATTRDDPAVPADPIRDLEPVA